ncbi:MAG: alpha-galactosidase [Spirochaetaceae bacterium]|nr:alpha-galactosidase [Spirochaetaceae bacterium]
MKVDPRFSANRDEVEGRTSLIFRAARDFEARESVVALAEIDFDELCDLAGAGEAARAALHGKGRSILSNGWQSWSFGGELELSERVRRSLLIEGFNVQTSHPALREPRGSVDSHFLTWVRSGEDFLHAVSLNARVTNDASVTRDARVTNDRALPPVTFRWRRGDLSLAAMVYAEGASFAAGESVAEIAVFSAHGFFAAKDALGAAFRDRRRPASAPGGYGSWYRHYAAIDDAKISGDLEALISTPNLINRYYLARGNPAVFQIDDGWEKAVGDWSPDPVKFPRGMAVHAQAIEAKGLIPGIWIAPFLVERRSRAFAERNGWLLRDGRGRPVVAGWNPAWGGAYHCLDVSLPEVEDYLAGVFDELVELWGFRYLKLDFLYAGLLRAGHGGGARAGGGAAYAAYDRIVRRITSRRADSQGRPVAYLGCGAPFEASFRHFPLMRIGTDTKEDWDWPLLRALRHQGRPSAYLSLTHTIGRTILDGTVFANDPDAVFCRGDRTSLTESEKELIALCDFLLASQLMTSDAAASDAAASPAAASPAKPGEIEFAQRLVGLFDRLGGSARGREYGALRIGRDVYEIMSRDGAVRGVANLSDRPWLLDPARYDPARAIVYRPAAAGGRAAVAPRSIALFEE